MAHIWQCLVLWLYSTNKTHFFFSSDNVNTDGAVQTSFWVFPLHGMLEFVWTITIISCGAKVHNSAAQHIEKQTLEQEEESGCTRQPTHWLTGIRNRPFHQTIWCCFRECCFFWSSWINSFPKTSAAIYRMEQTAFWEEKKTLAEYKEGFGRMSVSEPLSH